MLNGSNVADFVNPASIWLEKERLDENLKFPFICAEFLLVELTSIKSGSVKLIKSSPNDVILKSEGPVISVRPISYPSFDSIIIWSKSDVLIACKPVCDENWFIALANEDISVESIVADIDTGSVFLPTNFKLMLPLVPFFIGPRSILVFASTDTPVSAKSVFSLLEI